MADNTTITPGGGLTVATDDVAGVHFQRVKLADGTADSATMIVAGEGAAAAALRVDLATDGSVVGIVTETAPATDTASSGLNGRLQRIAQRLTSLIAVLPSKVDDSAFGVATDYVSPIAALADETATDSVDEGDVGAVRMTLDRRLHVAAAVYNGTSWDALRNNVEATLLGSAVRAATTASADQTNHNGRTALIVFDITAVPGIDTVTLTIQGKDPISGTYYTILAGAAQVATGTIIMQVGQAGLTAVPNLVANNLLPRTWRVNVVHSAASNFTYSVSASVGV